MIRLWAIATGGNMNPQVICPLWKQLWLD